MPAASPADLHAEGESREGQNARFRPLRAAVYGPSPNGTTEKLETTVGSGFFLYLREKLRKKHSGTPARRSNRSPAEHGSKNEEDFMKRMRITLGAVFLALSLFCGWNMAYAAEIDRGVLTVSQDWVRQGQEVDVAFALEGFTDVEDGINALQGTLAYDKTVFAEVQPEDFTPGEGWENLYYNPENGQLIIINKVGDRDGGEVFRLKLKAKAQLNLAETAIRFSDVSLSEGQGDLQQAESSAAVQVIAEQAPSGGQSGGQQSQPGQSSGSQVTVTVQGTGAVPGTTPAVTDGHVAAQGTAGALSGSTTHSTTGKPQSGGSVSSAEQEVQPTPVTGTAPATGDSAQPQAATPENPQAAAGDDLVPTRSKLGFLVAGLLLLLCLILVLLASRQGRLGKKVARVLAALLLVAILAVAFGSFAFALSGKGDLNEDGHVDYTDVDLLAKHLVELERLEESQRVAADMDSSGRLTVNDLALLIRAVEKTIHYEVQLSSAVENRYLEKNQPVQLLFQAEVTYDARITGATVNGQTYPVEQAEDESAYCITLNTGTAAGLLPCHFTQVTLAGGQVVPVDYTETLEVLKDLPAVENFTTEELTDSVQLKAKFQVADPDGAFTTGTLELTRTSEEGVTVLASQAVTAGWNEVTLDLPEGQEGQLLLCLNYDRTTGQLEEDATGYTGTVTFQKDLLFQYEYDFAFAELKALGEDLNETGIFGKNQPVTLQFRSENRSQFTPERLTVNGTDYPVQAAEEPGVYRAALPGFGESGTQEIRVEQVILSNGKTFPLTGEAVTVEIQKEMPTVADLTVTETEAGRSLQVSFALSDPDGALSNRKVVVKAADGTVLRELPFGENRVQETLDLPDTLTASYTVEVTADCDISQDGSAAQPGKVLAQQTIQAQIRVVLGEAKTDKTYYEKGEQATFFCGLATNAASPVEKLVLNNVALDATPGEDGLYSVTLPVQDQAGAQELQLSRVILTDGTVLTARADCRIEILRELPTVRDYEAWDDFDNDQVHFAFTVEDPDQALVGGTVVLTAEDGSEAPAQQAITAAGQQKFAFAVAEDKPYTFTVTLNSQRSADGTQPVTEEVLSCPIEMIRDYGLTVSDLTSARADGTPTLYFEKGEDVRIAFTSENQTRFVPRTLVSGEAEYPLTATGDGRYLAALPGGEAAGVNTFTADALRMNNGKLVALDGGRQVRYEILKDAPSVEGFASRQTEQDELEVQFTLNDADGALQSARVTITDERGSRLLDADAQTGPNSKTVNLTTGEQYTVAVTATYDRDTDTLAQDANRHTDETIFTQEVSASREAIELKDVTAQTLYLYTGADSRKVEMLDITQGLPDTGNYYVLVQMKDQPDFYAGVREFRLDQTTGKLYVVLDQEGLIAYHQDGSKSNTYAFPIAYRDGDKDHTLIESAEDLFRRMAADPDGTFELTCDLDASGIATGSYAVPGTFTGTLQGNGHSIYNLPVGLFQKLSKATITDLVLENARITAAHNGILAGSIESQTVVEKVYLVDCTLSNATNMTGGFTGKLSNSTVRQSAAINLTLKADNTIGGIAGQTDPGSVVEDCYVTGQLQGTRSHNLGARVGGISGWHSGAMIQRCVTKVNITAPKNEGNGGIIGGPGSANTSKISHCVSLGGGTAYRIAGFTAALAGAEEVYEYAGSNSTTNRTDANADKIKEVETLDRAFYADTLGLDAAIWHLDLVDSGKLPSLQGDPLPKTQTDYDILENANGIPSYQRVHAQADYRADREIAYANLAKLAPYADTADWVAYGNGLPAGSALVTSPIQYILPLDEAGNLVTGLDTRNPGAVQRVRLVYTDGTAQTVPVSYKKALGNLVAVYRLDGTGLGAGELPYQFRGYLKDLAQLDLAGLVQTAAALDYHNDLASLTSETEGRLYLDYYTETVQPKVETVVRQWVLSQAQFPAYTTSPAVQSLMAQRLQDRSALARTLYAYSYYDKWYHIRFDGVTLSDLLFFSGDLLNTRLSAAQLTDTLLATTSALRGTNKTYDFYTQNLKPYTGMELLDFLAKLAKGAGYDDPSDWFAAEFDGILVEQPADSLREGIEYRIWHLFNTLGSRRQIVLPILTAPQEDMYILTVPSQLILGSMNRYNTYVNKDGGERARMEEMIRSYAQRYAHFYGVSANWITRAPEILNSFVNIQYDTRFNFPGDDVINPGEQVKGVTQDPVIKWVYEAIGAYSDMGGVGAYANGTDVYCVAYPAIGTDFTFYALTHETAHNQDGRYFYAGYGRRSGTGAEAHADGNIAQQIEDGSMVFNISRICDPASDVTNNLSYQRIETADQVWDYYTKMFDTSYVIDYLAGQAFLQLTPEEQARVAIQASEVQQGNSIRSVYTRLTADDFRAMDLKTMDDLWDHRIALKTPGERASGSGAYGYESFYDINWYQPHFDGGTPDSSSFKRLGQEMLGVGGYENGYVTYISAKSPNDLQALRTITGNPDITWRAYKLGRYAEVAAKLDQIPYFDADQVIEQFKQAFRQDNDKRNQSIALQRTLYGVIKRATGDFVTGSVYGETDPIRITSAGQLLQAVQENPMGYYLLENDLDFSGLTADQGAYITARFIGTLDGNGHSLMGVSYPLFKEMVYGQIMNLTLDAPTYAGDAAAYLALSAKNTILSDVRLENANINLPLVKQKSAGYYELGTVGATIGQKTISSVEEFLAIGSSDTTRKMEYVLTRDLDFQDVALDKAAVSGTFSGKLDGAGHTIRNLSAPLFETADSAQIRNLTLEGANLTRNTDKGLLANTLSNAQVENLRITGSSLINNSNQVGMVAGLTRASTLRRITLENITVSANNTVGGVAGQMDGTTLEDCLVTGAVRGVLNNNLGSRAGGITGWLSSNSTLKNCYVKAEISGAKPQGNGGLIGGPNTGNAQMYNSLSLSTGANAYRLSGFPVLGVADNLYELADSDSLTNRDETNADRIKQVTGDQLLDPGFYTDSLGWSEEIWDFSQVASGGTPQLRTETLNVLAVTEEPDGPAEEELPPETTEDSAQEAPAEELPPEEEPALPPEQATAESALAG